MNHGGKRNGAGRPRSGKRKRIYGFSIHPKVMEQLGIYVEKGKWSKWIERTIQENLP